MRRRPDPHGWNSWQGYCAAHDGKIKSLAGFVVEDRVERTITPKVAHWRGEVLCADGYEVHVEREQAVEVRRGVPWVVTRTYSYHALRRVGTDTVNMLRYDNIHAHAGHPTPHHRHEYGPDSGDLRVRHVPEPSPGLGQVLDELQAIWSRAG